MSAETFSMFREKERTREVYRGVCIGRLGDFGLGNPEGIPSQHADKTDAELEAVAHEKAQQLVAPTDLRATSCIDGRERIENADGSAPQIRLRRVGGTASDCGVARNAEAPIVGTLPENASLGEQITAVEGYLESATGFGRSAHLGGCGGANGEVSDNEAISQKPAIFEATKALMNIPAVRKYLGVEYGDEELDELGARVQARAGETAASFREKGWDGKTYVDGVKEENPRGVEALETGDDRFHGHKEGSLIIILGGMTYANPDDFVWNLEATKKVAEGLGSRRGAEGYVQALIADIAKHMAVADRLPTPDMPVMLLFPEE